MAAVMEDYLESPMDNDDVFPCKGCGEVCWPTLAIPVRLQARTDSGALPD